MIQPGEHQHHTIWTPELVEISMPLAGVGRRILATLLDHFIVSLVIIGIWVGASIVFAVSVSAVHDGLASAVMLGMWIGLMGFSALAYAIYFWCFHTFSGGRTLGKMALGTRLVTDRGGRPNGWTCLIRVLFDLLDFLLLYGSISLIIMLVSDKEKRIADYAAGTMVILDR